MNQEAFKRLYLCDWQPDPIMEECVAFVRYATDKEIAKYKRDGFFSQRQIAEAKRIIESEEYGENK